MWWVILFYVVCRDIIVKEGDMFCKHWPPEYINIDILQESRLAEKYSLGGGGDCDEGLCRDYRIMLWWR